MTAIADDDTELSEYLNSLDLDDQQSHYAEALLTRLVLKLQDDSSDYPSRYGEFLSANQSIHATLSKCLRHPVHELFSTSEIYSRLSLKNISAVAGDVKFHGRAIYLHIVYLPDDEGAPNKIYLYVGQALNLSFRIKQHQDFRYRRDNLSFHNYAMDRSMGDRFVVLATFTERVSRPDLALNILEMWCALLLRTLPMETLCDWLSDDVEHQVSWMPLNVASPLDHGDELKSRGAFELLKDAEDGLARTYYADVKKGFLRPRASPRNTSRIGRMKSAPITPVPLRWSSNATIAIRDEGRGESAEEVGQVPKADRPSQPNAPQLPSLVDERNELALGMAIGMAASLGLFWVRTLVQNTSSK
jgi:hypothetical protein